MSFLHSNMGCGNQISLKKIKGFKLLGILPGQP